MSRPAILHQSKDLERLMDKTGMEYNSWYKGSGDVLRLKNKDGEYNILKMFPDYKIFNSLVKSLGFGTSTYIDNEVRVLEKMDKIGFDVPKIIDYGSFKCSESKNSYKYLVKEYVKGYNWYVGKPLSPTQLEELEDKIKSFHSNGFANFDLGVNNDNINILVSEDSHVHLFDMNLVKEKSKTSMFQRYVSVDLFNLEQIIEYNSKEFLEKTNLRRN